MENYFAMNYAQLLQEQKYLTEQYNKYLQMNLRLDMSRGKPCSEQLDLSMPMLQIVDYKDDTGVDARNYGFLEGLPETRRFFSEWMGVSPDQVVVGGNSSLQLMYLWIDMACQRGLLGSAKPWKAEENRKFLCPVPGYDRHFRVTQEFGFELISVPMTSDGPDMDVVEELSKDPAVKGIWCVPVYSNPDGYVFSEDTVKRLAKMKTGAADFQIMWDNAYGVHHLTEIEYSCPSLFDLCKQAGNENRPVQFCSTSKITFAGAGVGAVAASKANIDGFLKHLFAMTITFDKMNALRHVRFLKSQGGIRSHMKKHAELLAPRFEVVISTLQAELSPCGDIARWTSPKGGYFISLYTLPGCAKRIVELCKEAGVILTGAGAAYPNGKDPLDVHIRIAPTFPPILELQTATDLLCIATKLVSIEKYLQENVS